MDKEGITVLTEKIEEFCHRWKVAEFALFGSVLREDFRSDSDIDILVSFEKGADWDLFDWVNMIEELKGDLRDGKLIWSRRPPSGIPFAAIIF